MCVCVCVCVLYSHVQFSTNSHPVSRTCVHLHKDCWDQNKPDRFLRLKRFLSFGALLFAHCVSTEVFESLADVLFSFHHRDFRRKNIHISPCVSLVFCSFPGKVSVGCLCSISELYNINKSDLDLLCFYSLLSVRFVSAQYILQSCVHSDCHYTSCTVTVDFQGTVCVQHRCMNCIIALCFFLWVSLSSDF